MQYYIFEIELMKNFYYEINNKSLKSIVVFGNCHASTIAFYLDVLLKHKYNIFIVVAYSDHRINDQARVKKIMDIVKNADYLIYQKYKQDFGVNASRINEYATGNKILIPNLILHFTDLYGKGGRDKETVKVDFEKSYNLLKKNIEASDFPNFAFILDNLKTVRYFNIPLHPTHYLLYLLSLQILYKITNINKKISFTDYQQHKLDPIFLNTETITLPGFYQYRKDECKWLDINPKSEYYDLKTS